MKNARAAAASALREYFDDREVRKTEDAFDDWFCKKALPGITKYDLTVGQAQKILNMAFKYLYCCQDIREKRESQFNHCHMPLDGYTMAWYNKNCSVVGYHGAWSKLDHDLYFTIQMEIRKKLGTENVLRREFTIWQDRRNAVNKQ